MGRLLDIARAVAVVDTGPEERARTRIEQSDHTAYRTAGGLGCEVSERSAVSRSVGQGGDFIQPAADVLAVLIKADTPLLHTAIVAALADRGHGKAAAYKAIADVQGRGWIEHNLITGYIIAGERKGDSHVR